MQRGGWWDHEVVVAVLLMVAYGLHDRGPLKRQPKCCRHRLRGCKIGAVSDRRGAERARARLMESLE